MKLFFYFGFTSILSDLYTRRDMASNLTNHTLQIIIPDQKFNAHRAVNCLVAAITTTTLE